MERLFQLVERYCFQGHTHVPGVFTEGYQFYAPEEIDNEYTLGDGKVMINVGSVGQPRDGDPRACYVILDDGVRRPMARQASPVEGAHRRPRASRGRHPRAAPARADPRPLPPPALRLRDDDPEDLRHPRARTVPGRPAPPGTLAPSRPVRRHRPDSTPPRAPPWPQGLPHDEQREADHPVPRPDLRLVRGDAISRRRIGTEPAPPASGPEAAGRRGGHNRPTPSPWRRKPAVPGPGPRRGRRREGRGREARRSHSAQPSELVLKSDRLEVQLEQAQAGVETVVSSRYEAELEDGKAASSPAHPRRCARDGRGPKRPPSMLVTLVPTPDGKAAEPEGAAADPAFAIDSLPWEVVRDDEGRAVRPVAKAAANRQGRPRSRAGGPLPHAASTSSA